MAPVRSRSFTASPCGFILKGMPTYLGEIKIAAFGYAPQGWALCNGQLLRMEFNQALFSILGARFGGSRDLRKGLRRFLVPHHRAAVDHPLETAKPAQIGDQGIGHPVRRSTLGRRKDPAAAARRSIRCTRGRSRIAARRRCQDHHNHRDGRPCNLGQGALRFRRRHKPWIVTRPGRGTCPASRGRLARAAAGVRSRRAATPERCAAYRHLSCPACETAAPETFPAKT